MRFDDKVVLITGGARGIGAAISSAFADKGAKCVLSFQTNRKVAEAHVAMLPGNQHSIYAADVASLDDCRKLVEFVVAEYGHLDILINNAGVFLTHDIHTISYDAWEDSFQQTLAVNFFGPARLMYLAAKVMRLHGGGRIVNISSRGAFRGEPDQPAYGASKAGLNALGQSLAKKLAPDNIFIGTVAPGFVHTDMGKAVLDGPKGDEVRNQSPLNRVATPEEVAHATLFLASEGAEFTTGTILDVNGASYLR